MSVLKAIGKYFALLFLFFAAAIGVELIFIAIAAVLDMIGLTSIPLIGWLRDNYLDGLPVLAAIAGYSVATSIAKKIDGYPPLLAVGITVSLIHAVFMVINIANKDIISVFMNICLIVAGVVLVFHARDAIRKVKEAQLTREN